MFDWYNTLMQILSIDTYHYAGIALHNTVFKIGIFEETRLTN